MTDCSNVLLVMTNVPGIEVARNIAEMLLERRLAACVNCLPGVESVYRWKGSIERADEVCLLIKTTVERYAELELALSAAHPYDLPELIAVPVTAGLPAYLQWIGEETKKDADV